MWVVMQDGLRKIRKQLVISTGSLEPTPAAPSASTSKGKKGETTEGPMFKKFFKASDDDEEEEEEEPSNAQGEPHFTEVRCI